MFNIKNFLLVESIQFSFDMANNTKGRQWGFLV